MNAGRYGSNAVRREIQAPLIPRLSSSKGPTQHAEAPIPARIPPTRAVFVLSGERIVK